MEKDFNAIMTDRAKNNKEYEDDEYFSTSDHENDLGISTVKKDEKKKSDIERIVKEKGWLENVESVTFLAAGEYNENYVITSGERRYVFRINHGSQIEQENQIGYEFHVLKCVEPSGVTPKVYHVAPDSALGGVLLMDYIPGKPFVFHKDLDKVPPVFAAIHTVPLPLSAAASNSICDSIRNPIRDSIHDQIHDQIRDPIRDSIRDPIHDLNCDPIHDLICDSIRDLPPLLRQIDPIGDIAAESLRLIERFEDHPLKRERKILRSYHEKILFLREKEKALFKDEPLCLVNTEVNSGNFIVQDDSAFLVDWEKAVISYRYQDLAHFIIPTTTLWKSDFTFTPDSRRSFLKQYHDVICRDSSVDFPFDAMDYKTAILEKTILLRALSWCFMAWYEYTNQGQGESDRTLIDETTRQKINRYLDEIEWLLK